MFGKRATCFTACVLGSSVWEGGGVGRMMIFKSSESCDYIMDWPDVICIRLIDILFFAGFFLQSPLSPFHRFE